MRILLPRVLGVQEKQPKGTLAQLLAPPTTFIGRATRFTVPSATGWCITADDGGTVYIFPRAPRPENLPAGNTLLGTVPDLSLIHI